MDEVKQGSHKNIWYGIGRQRIEIPRPVLKSVIQSNALLNHLYIASLGFYPKAKGHLTRRRHGLHENFLFYCVDGYGWYEIDGEKHEVGPNEFFILPQNIEHAYASADHDPWSIYWIHFGGNSLPDLNNLHTVKEHFKPKHVKDNGELVALFTKMYKTLELGYSLDNLFFANLCLSQFLSVFIYNSRHYPASQTTKNDCVDNAILYMQEHITDMLTLRDISNYSNYSISRFSNLFKQKTGYAPMDYFMQMKIQQACQQLDFTDKSIKEIALTLGFDDPYYFSKRFKQVTGMPPVKYRSVNKD
ncbi:AraC family transcriptional regulator [Niabella insulamsoli]|uniref:AraC family transcriptional regulator n=1 Tax=Niabella insulamsoli TaxID=3144874 RepID=UPI0031FDB8BC